MSYIVAVFLLTVLPRAAFACSCETSLPKIYSKAQAIFVGQITETYRVKEHIPFDVIRGKFEVIETLKGDPGSIPYVEAHVNEGIMCTFSLQSGLRYFFVVDQEISIGCTSLMLEHFPARQWLADFRKMRDSLK